MYTFEREYRMTIEEMTHRRMFVSWLLCRNHLRQVCVLGCRGHLLAIYKEPYIHGEIKTKVNPSIAIMNAQSRGRLLPNDNDLYNSQPVSFQVLDKDDIEPSVPVEIYVIS